MKAAANDSFGYTDDEIVSSDVIGMSYGSLFDGTQTSLIKCGEHEYLVRVNSWYDNEMSYVNQLIRTMKHMGTLL
jgi:glyceraldehyde 3-phosphate dehydrogenase